MIKKLFLIPLMSISFSTLYSNDEVQERFDNAKCMSCHSSFDFSHKENKVNNFSKLHKQVNMCAVNNGANWFDDETMDVTKYLNKLYYFYNEANRHSEE